MLAPWSLSFGDFLVLGAWCLVFASRPSFWILHSDFVINTSCSRCVLQPTDNWPLTTDNRQLIPSHERLAVRLPATAEEPRLHRRRGAYARPRHRGEHGHLQRHQ